MNAGSGKPALTARIGIETGSVVVDAAGEIYGDAPNTAARMQGLADGILVTSRFNARFLVTSRFNARSPACLSPRSAAVMNSKAYRSR